MYVYTPDHIPQPKSTQINLQTILPPLPDNPDHILPQIIQEILKTCGVDLARFECHNTIKQDVKLQKYN